MVDLQRRSRPATATARSRATVAARSELLSSGTSNTAPRAAGPYPEDLPAHLRRRRRPCRRPGSRPARAAAGGPGRAGVRLGGREPERADHRDGHHHPADDRQRREGAPQQDPDQGQPDDLEHAGPAPARPTAVAAPSPAPHRTPSLARSASRGRCDWFARKLAQRTPSLRSVGFAGRCDTVRSQAASRGRCDTGSLASSLTALPRCARSAQRGSTLCAGAVSMIRSLRSFIGGSPVRPPGTRRASPGPPPPGR